MPPTDDGISDPTGRGRRFEPTQWNFVLAARGNQPAAREAMQHLCKNYWYPLYAFVRRQRYDPHDAHDLTQAFFTRLLEKGWLDQVAREKGKFRSFLLAAMKHFLANERDRNRAAKRGGGRHVVSLDARLAESRYATEPRDEATPEKIFDRRWAITLLENVLSRLRGEMTASGKGALFEELKTSLEGPPSGYAQIADRLGMTEGAVKVASLRLRQRYQKIIRNEIAQTVVDEKEIEDELRDLLSALKAR